MGSEWPIVSIGELADARPGALAVGPFGSRMKADLYVPAGVRVIRGNNLGDGRQLKGDFVHVTTGTADSLASCCLIPGDLVFPHRGNIGEVGVTPDDGHRYMLSTSLMKLSPDRAKVDPLYLLYFFKGPTGRSALLMNASQVGTPGIATPLKSLRGIELPLPPLEVQRTITVILQTLDDRITLLRETNATLEAIAQALFKSWFVDFDPVRAKMEGRTPEGMDEATAALFPDGFETPELGEVPRGWKYCSLKEVCSIFDSKRVPLSGAERAKRRGPYPYYGAAALMDYVDEYLFDGIYLLTGEDGSVADEQGFSITQYVWGKFWVNNHAHILQGKADFSTEHLALALRRVNIQPYITGAVQAKLSQSNMWRINVLHPGQGIAEAFGALIAPLYEAVRANVDQAQTLSSLRDTLLPRLISGQLRLPEAQAALEVTP